MSKQGEERDISLQGLVIGHYDGKSASSDKGHLI